MAAYSLSKITRDEWLFKSNLKLLFGLFVAMGGMNQVGIFNGLGKVSNNRT